MLSQIDKVEFVFLILFMLENNIARDGLALDRCEDVKPDVSVLRFPKCSLKHKVMSGFSSAC